MLNPRIYRMGLIPVVLAVIVFAFSLDDQQAALGTNVVPDAFNGSNAFASMGSLAKQYPLRRPGSRSDQRLAGTVESVLHGYGFHIIDPTRTADTALGGRPVENVIASRAGAHSGSVVIVSHRDALAAPATAGLSGTAVMLELARVLSGQSLNRTLVLASTSGSDGAAGAQELVSEIPGPVDAVIVLGDLAGADGDQPVVLPWSNGQSVAPTALRNTVRGAVKTQTGAAPAESGVGGQLAHLAFPMSGTEQAPFVAAGVPAVLLSLSSSPDTPAREPTSQAEIGAMGRALLLATTALEQGPTISSPSSYLIWADKVIPAWAVRLLVLVLMLPVLAVTVDGVARARRKGHLISRWIGWVAVSALPFILAVLLVLIAGATSWIAAAPPAPVRSGVVPLGGGGIALLVLTGILIVGGLLWLRRLVTGALGLGHAGPAPPPRKLRAIAWRPRADADPAAHGYGAAAGVMVVLCAVSLAIWLANPFAALLLVPALHLWVWAVAPEPRLPLAARIVMLLVGLAPGALAALAFASTFGLGPIGMAWSTVLLLAGGVVGLAGAIEWSLVLACAISVALLIVRAARAPAPEARPVTIRGPVSYAGPGSLGGTESALRR
jgi:Peptidase family M28